MITTGIRRIAGFFCIAYMLVQSYQEWVYSNAPTSTIFNEAVFLFEAAPQSILRSWLMLLSMFGLFFIFFSLCFIHSDKNKGWSMLAFSSFSVFCLLEIILRSIELFYTQIQLPHEYLNASVEMKATIINYVTHFQKIQGALYFPLGFCWMVGSFILAAVIPRDPVQNYVLRGALYFNGVRLLLRMITNYLGVNLFPSPLYDLLYLPMVYVTFGLIGWWLFRYPFHAKNKVLIQ